MSKLSGWDDTIVALATAQGVSAIGVIRVSGTNAIGIINDLFPSKDLSKQASHTIHVGMLKNDDELLDEVVVSLFKNPKSFTGEDVIEIGCHGSPFIQEKIMQAITQKGARMAKPGEFTQRAFLNGKLDLTQAEAVADLIASNTEASRKTALTNIRGGFSTVLSELREQLIKFSALIELELDFSQEDVEFADRTLLRENISLLQSQCSKLLQSFILGNVIKQGVKVAIIGKPNAGKSTLLNTLLNENRAIVSDIAGTTRDTIEEIINIKGILFRLIDTAGIREHTTDVIEKMGVEKSYDKMKEADVVLYLFDRNDTPAAELEMLEEKLSGTNMKYLLVANKADLNSTENIDYKTRQPIINISAKVKNNIEELINKLFVLAVNQDIEKDAVIVTNARHYQSLERLSKALEEVQEGMNNNIPGDLLALDIKEALQHLGEITGEITSEDQLDFIFSKFCIGK
jgi:tRNA modification GTPase